MPCSLAQLRADHPDLFLLDAGDPASIQTFLAGRGLLPSGSPILSAQKAGDGNMNCVVRVLTERCSWVLKQSRPWVEKYPQFAAPWDRACREAEFYRMTESCSDLAARMPRLLDFDAASRVLVLEDLGSMGDYSEVYRGARLTTSELGVLASFLSELHRSFTRGAEPSPLPNREMRELNHAHIFRIPLEPDNGLDLDAFTPGLDEAAAELRADAAYVEAVARLGVQHYLADGDHLVHGDFFPGSLLRTTESPTVIDPEFCHFGGPEFDVGVFLAHLILSDQGDGACAHWLRAYTPPQGFDHRLVFRFAGVEIMRRLIGYAQLPIVRGLVWKRRLLELARSLLMHPDPSLL